MTCENNLQPSRRLLGYRAQNPAPFDLDSQDFITRAQKVSDQIMAVFLRSLPSNYVSTTTGPYYTVQFRSAVDVLAKFQVLATEIYEDQDFYFTRPEVLYQTLGKIAFPDTTRPFPQIDGDVSFRDVLRKMVVYLLRGSTTQSIESGLESIVDGVVSVIESEDIRNPFSFQAFLEGNPITTTNVGHYHEVDLCSGITTNTIGAEEHTHIVADWTVQEGVVDDTPHTHWLTPRIPSDIFRTLTNAQLILDALRPAHTVYDLGILLRETGGRYVEGDFVPSIAGDEVSSSMQVFYYDDTRTYWLGAQSIVGEGTVLNDRMLFSDPYVDFSGVLEGATIVIDGQHLTVSQVLQTPFPNDSVPRPYTTVSGLSGNLTVSGSRFTDSLQDFSICPEGDILTIASGPNAGQYRLHAVAGENGGVLGMAQGPCDTVIPSYSLLRLNRRMESGSYEYAVNVDRLGRLSPITVNSEDVSRYCWL